VKRITRKNLKSDKFAEEVSTIWDWTAEHKDEVVRYGAIALAVLLVAGGIFYYVRYQAGVRADALSAAIRIDNANVGGQAQPGMMQFATQDEKDKAWVKAFTEVATKYHGTQEGAIAEMYMASSQIDKGDLAGAEKRYRDIVDSAPKAYAGMAKVSLADTLDAEGKTDEAEKVLKDLIAHPVVTVSKEEATIQLALMVGRCNQDEGRKMLEPLRTGRTAVSRAAVQALGDLAQETCNK
jgi:predicted negative regulator of RcsB-dependent stress response